jgi:hypothetical protein
VIEDVTGTAADPDAEAAAGDAPKGEAGTTAAAEAPAKAESFIDPSELPDELKPHWKRMHRAFTKRMEETKDMKDKAALVDQFRSDPNFALQTIQQAAQQMGYSLSKAQAAEVVQSAATAVGGGAPQELVAAVKAQLSPELQWMAPSLANTQWVTMQMQMAPLKKEREQEATARRNEEYKELAEELGEQAPGWEEHEDDMEELLTFLKSDSMKSRKFGSKLSLLHGIVTGNASAVASAVRRMGEASRNRTSTGQAGRSTAPNIDKRVREAKTDQDAWQIAAQAAVEDLERQGVKLR